MTPESGRGVGVATLGEAAGWNVGLEVLVDAVLALPPPPHAVPITAANMMVPAAPGA